jgi:hypothetical protein
VRPSFDCNGVPDHDDASRSDAIHHTRLAVLDMDGGPDGDWEDDGDAVAGDCSGVAS